VHVQDELSRAVVRLLRREAFFGHLLGQVTRRITRETDTLGVARTPAGLELRVNPDFFLKDLRRLEQRVAVLKHEALHLLFKHLFRRNERDPELFNLAADLVVNQFIGRWPLPEYAVTLATFPDLGLEPDRDVDWYYDQLVQLQDDPDGAPRSAEALAGLQGQAPPSDHQAWGEGEPGPVSDAWEAAIDQAVEQARERTNAQQWSALPGAIQEQVSLALARRRPRVDWKRTLRLFAASSMRTKVVNTARRESRRYATPERPGWPVTPGIRVKRFQRLAVVVDTSGSVGDTDVGRLFAEVRGIWRAGAELHIIEADAHVQATYPFTGDAPASLSGRGGTRFDPALQWLRDNRSHRFDGCIYLTDGAGPAPTVRPPCRLLWLLTPGAPADTGHLRYGRVVRLVE
jgi:predicted metal-dependent peptidase